MDEYIIAGGQPMEMNTQPGGNVSFYFDQTELYSGATIDLYAQLYGLDNELSPSVSVSIWPDHQDGSTSQYIPLGGEDGFPIMITIAYNTTVSV
jgi:hypothetical protein